MTDGTRIDVFDADTNRPLCGSPMFVENGATSKGMLAPLVKRVEFARSMAVKRDARVDALARELEAARTRHVMALSHRRSRMGIDTLEVGILLRPEWVDEARARQWHELPLLLLRCNGQVAGRAYAREIEDALVRFTVRRRIPTINDTLYSVHDVATEETLCALVTPPFRRARRILGMVESRPEAHLRGWTLDPDHPLRCGRVAIHVAGRLREVIDADEPHDDIARGRGTGGRHGFLWDIPDDLIANEGERIDVFDADTGLPLRGSPLSLQGIP